MEKNQKIIMYSSLEQLYENIKKQKEPTAILLLQIRDWVLKVFEFDVRSGDPLTKDLYYILDKVSSTFVLQKKNENFFDYLSRLITHATNSIDHIIETTREKVVRSHKNLPMYKAKELDINSIVWLSRQPGRSIKEKLAAKPYVKAVQRNMSFDSLENRLTKECLILLSNLIEQRYEAFYKMDQIDAEVKLQMELVQIIKHWLREEEVELINNWSNLPPNNVLLQDKNYRKIWDIWLALQSQGEQIIQDQIYIHAHVLKILYWKIIVRINQLDHLYLYNQPCLLKNQPIDIQAFSKKIVGIFLINQSKTFISLDMIDDHSFEIQYQKEHYLFQISDDFEDHKADQNSKLIHGINLNGKKITFELDEIDLVVEKIISQILNKNLLYSSTKTNKKIYKSNFAALDSTHLYPKIQVIEQQEQIFQNTLLIYQNWKLKDGYFDLLLEDHQCILISDHIKTISSKFLFGTHPVFTKSDLNKASDAFATYLSYYLDVDDLIYLIPDAADDFELETLRRSIQFQFRRALSLPKSINQILSLQANQKLPKDLKHQDLFFHIDFYKDQISITPIMAILDPKNNDLRQEIPVTNGFTWERYPSSVVEIDFRPIIIQFLEEKGCLFADQIFELFDIPTLLSIKQNILFIHQIDQSKLDFDSTFLLDQNLSTRLHSLFFEILQSKMQNIVKSISSEIKNIKLNKNNHAYVVVNDLLKKLPLDTHLIKDLLVVPQHILDGVFALRDWEALVPHIPLWKDNLPPLAIEALSKGRKTYFDLVKSTTIIPERGKTIPIEIKQEFILRANKKLYQFKLSQGEGLRELEHIISLKSDAFPLETDLPCRLNLTYTYGKDQPYELEFVDASINTKIHKPIKALWTTDPLEPPILNAPMYPSIFSWSDMELYPNKEPNQPPSDLLDWIKKQFYYLKNNINFHQRGINKIDEIKKNLKNMRFPFIMVWNQGRSIYDLDANLHFKNLIQNQVFPLFLELFQADNKYQIDPFSVSEEIFTLILCTHKDIPIDLIPEITRLITNVDTYKKYSYFYSYMAYSLGDLSEDWQLDCFKQLIDMMTKKELNILAMISIIVWRTENAIQYLDAVDYEIIVKQLLSSLQSSYKRMIYQNRKTNKFEINRIDIYKIELIFALLRSRESNDPTIANIFAYQSPYVKKYLELIDNIEKHLYTNGFTQIDSRIHLDVKKDEYSKNVPDLLYAIRLYLTGEDEGAIVIKDIISSASDFD